MTTSTGDFERRVYEAERRIRAKELELSSIKEHLKDAKDQLARAVEDLREIAREVDAELFRDALRPGERVDRVTGEVLDDEDEGDDEEEEA